MRDLKFEILRAALFTTFVSTYYLAAQFYVQAHFIRRLLNSIGIKLPNFDEQTDQAIEATILSGLTLLLVCLIYIIVYYRLTRNIVYHFNDFQKKIAGIADYHNRKLKALNQSIKDGNITDAEPLAPIWIDFILTDIADAFSSVLGHDGVRVSLFGLVEDKTINKEVMTYLQCNLIDGKPHGDVKFIKAKGYCGIAWALEQPIAGPDRYFPFLRSCKNYIEGRSGSKKESFICMPLLTAEEKCQAVICVDSTARYDFVLSETEKNNIYKTMTTLLYIISIHYLHGRFSNPKNIQN